MKDTETIYVYRPNLGIYTPDGEQLIRELASNRLENASRQRHVKEVVFHVKVSTYMDRKEFEPPLYLIPLRNGVLDIQPNPPRITKYLPEYYFTNQLQVIYDHTAKCSRFFEFLKASLPNKESRVQVQELFGSCLCRNYLYQKIFAFVGDGANGKSTLLNVLKSFLGFDNISCVSLRYLAENRFASANLYRKYANIYADLTIRTLKHTGMIKMLSGGDPISAEYKFKNPFNFINYAKLVFSANQLPLPNDDSYAFYRRWIIIYFPNKFTHELGNNNPKILDEITTKEELSGILNWALEGLARLRENNQFSFMRTTEEIRDLYLSRSSSLYMFVKDMVVTDPLSEISREEFYSKYVEYCIEKILPIMSKNEVGRDLVRFVPSVSSTRPKIKGEGVYSWKGIRIK